MIRVLVVDDSALVRRLVTTSLSVADDIEVVGTACNGREAIDQIAALEPDAVSLDIEMPVLDGLGALPLIRRTHPRLPVIMFSTLTEAGAAKTLQALALGASDYVTKPSNTDSIGESMASVRNQLIPKIRALAGMRRTAGDVAAAPARRARRVTTRPEVLVIGSSTGGPDALSTVLAGLPATLPVPVLVVQHMPPVFTTIFAERLDRVSPLTVREAADREVLVPGHVLVAPGDFHLEVRRSPGGAVRTHLGQGDPVNFCRPAVDVLFSSAAATYGVATLGLVLTGMGHDGLDGCRELSGLGAPVMVQDEPTSVVWGMPGAVATAGIADEILPLDEIAAAVAHMLTST